MTECGGKVYKFVLTLLGIVFVLVGIMCLSYSVWLKQNYTYDTRGPSAFLLSMFVWILIVQGPLMVIMGIYGICRVWMKKEIGFVAFGILLIILALTDTVVGIIIFFKCTENCPKFIRDFPGKQQLALGMFLGVAALLTITLICHFKFTNRVQVDITAHYSTPS